MFLRAFSINSKWILNFIIPLITPTIFTEYCGFWIKQLFEEVRILQIFAHPLEAKPIYDIMIGMSGFVPYLEKLLLFFGN